MTMPFHNMNPITINMSLCILTANVGAENYI